MHKVATSKWGQSPLEKLMMDIRDTSMDITNISTWLGEPKWGGTKSARAQLKICSDRLDAIYDKLHKITGAHPCK